MGSGLAVFFDIGDTLASPVVSGGALAGLDVYPFVPEVLDRLGDAEVPVGLISNTGSETAASLRQVLGDAGLLDRLDDDLLLFSSVEGLDKSHRAFFELAAARAGLPAGRCLFVGESEDERAVAAAVGLVTSPHALHALHLVETELLTDPSPTPREER
jgi:FMN phosphatase YigB (HAD superfamily)